MAELNLMFMIIGFGALLGFIIIMTNDGHV